MGRDKFLQCRLPSGRILYYYDPQIELTTTPWGQSKETVTYMGVDSQTRQWRRHWLHGGIMTENITQAVARDILAAIS